MEFPHPRLLRRRRQGQLQIEVMEHWQVEEEVVVVVVVVAEGLVVLIGRPLGLVFTRP
jgi:hypothetical protein